jgi:hypothetical protein
MITEDSPMMTLQKLLDLWNEFQNNSGNSRLQSSLVLSENILWQICCEPYFIEMQNFNLSLGTSATWRTMFEMRGIPQVLLIKTPDVLEFVSNS